MRYASDHKQKTHERIVRDAARLFRERGYAGCGVDAVMTAAGLTAGGFYSHFANKEALLAEVLSLCLGGRRSPSDPTATELAGRPLADWVIAYTSAKHRDRPAAGCVIPTLAPEVARQGAAARSAFTAALREQVAELIAFAPGDTDAEKTDAVLHAVAAAAGAVMLARAVDDPRLSDRILRAVSEAHRPPSKSDTASKKRSRR